MTKKDHFKWEFLFWFQVPFKDPATFLLILGIVSRNYKTSKLLFVSSMYRCNFSFRMNLTATLLQNLASFYMWNVKYKDDGMDQNTLHCRYDDQVTMNHQTQRNKTWWRDFVSLPCHIVWKRLSKLITCYWISVNFV